MHPNPKFRHADRALLETMIAEIGFGMVFATTPDGPRVAHVPLVSAGNGAVQFHIARGNALTRYLEGMTVLAVINGPDSYVSPRWYTDQGQVPTWNYVSLELEGRVRALDADGLLGHLEALSAREEARLAGEPWTMDKSPPDYISKLLGGISGFELEILAWRETVKLSQNKPADERERIAGALAENGSTALAALMRSLAP